MTETGKSLAQVAYEAYAEYKNWKAYNGEPIPQWSEVRLDIKLAWEEATKATAEEMMRRVAVFFS